MSYHVTLAQSMASVAALSSVALDVQKTLTAAIAHDPAKLEHDQLVELREQVRLAADRLLNTVLDHVDVIAPALSDRAAAEADAASVASASAARASAATHV